MNKKHGLGKGLAALIPEEEENLNNSSEFIIDINHIKPNNKQPRKFFDEEKIDYLAKSISEHGIIQPLVLNRDGEYYSIIAGERRWRAAKKLGLKEVPAVIMNLSDKDTLEISMIENLQREDLNPIEEALAYQRLILEFNLTQEELANRIGKSRTSISNCMRLLNLDNRVQEYLIECIITEGHGRTLLGLEDKELQYKISQKIIDENLSVRQTELLVRDIINNLTEKKTDSKDISKISPYHLEIKNKLENHFGTKVSLISKKNKGKIEIQYYSEEDLQRILEILKI